MNVTEPAAGGQAPGLAAGFHFGDAVISRSRSLGHCFCLGLDPHLAMIPAAFRRGGMDARDPQTVAAIEDFLTAVVDIAAPQVAVVKPQSAMYERLGSAGIALLERVVAHAHERGLLVVLDGKRNDIGSTAEAYAEAYLAPDAPNPVECLTVNPYMGIDTLEPFLRFCRSDGRGIFVLVKTSNPGSGDFQNLMTGNSRLYGNVALALKPIAETLIGPETGWSSLGVVVGATYPHEAADIRTLLPRTLFLIPGFGAQAGDLKQFAAALTPGPAGREGGLINSARATLFPPEAADGGFDAWKSAFSETLSRHIAAVAESLKS